MKNKKNLWPIWMVFILYVLLGMVTKKFDGKTLLTGLIITALLTLLFYRKNKMHFKERIKLFYQGTTNKMIIDIIIIFALVGVFCSCLKASGSMDAMIKTCISVIPLSYFLPFLFIISSVLSFILGTSVGTLGAMLPIAYGIATQAHLSFALVGGSVLGGAMFGDNLSFISDTTIAATQSMRVNPSDKFRKNLKLVIIPFILTILLLSLVDVEAIKVSVEPVKYLLVMPYILVLILIFLKFPLSKVLLLGITITICVGVSKGDMQVNQIIPVIFNGLVSMIELILITIIFAGVNEIVKVPLLNEFDLDNSLVNDQNSESIIAVVVSMITALIANNCISILTVGPLALMISESKELDNARVASILDIFASGVMGILPYGAQVLLTSQLMHVSVWSVICYSWYSWLILLFAIFSIVRRARKFKTVEILEAKRCLE